MVIAHQSLSSKYVNIFFTGLFDNVNFVFYRLNRIKKNNEVENKTECRQYYTLQAFHQYPAHFLCEKKSFPILSVQLFQLKTNEFNE